MKVSVCEQCGETFGAQKSTRLYCSEACKQKAKRARKRADNRLPSEARCEQCGGPLFPDNPERYREGNPAWTHRRKYCGHECRNAARRYRYRVVQLSETAPKRVTGPYDLTEPVPCWRSAEWHEIARVALLLMSERGMVLSDPHGRTGFIPFELLRSFVVGERSKSPDAAGAV